MTVVQSDPFKGEWEFNASLKFSIEYKNQSNTRLTYKEYYAA
jgi:hypothetical protein